MKSLKNLPILIGCLLFTFCLAASATTLLDTTTALTTSDPTQDGRSGRDGVSQDWVGSKTYPGIFNAGITYRYRTFVIPAASMLSGRFVQVSIDDLGASGNLFASVYANSYSPLSQSTNWLGDVGSSPPVFGLAPTFLQVLVPPATNLVIVVNNTAAGDVGVGEQFRLLAENFTDVLFGQPTPTPTPGPPVTVGLEAMPHNVAEGNDATFNFLAFQPPTQTITVHYSVSGKARLNVDYTLSGTPGQVQIPAGQHSAPLILHALNDTVRERKENVVITITPGTGYIFPTSGRRHTPTAPKETINILP